MSWTLRYRCEPGQKWVEHHKLIQVEHKPDEEPTGQENAWSLSQEVVKVKDGLTRVAWRREDAEPVEGAPPDLAAGEVWVDELGRASPDGKTWSPPVFPEHEVELDQTWTQEKTALGIPIHFKLEKGDDQTVSLVSYAGVETEQGTQETQGSVKVCARTGRVVTSTTVTKVTQPDGTVIQTVVEVETEGL